jgi:DNA repair protein RadC
MPQPARSRSRHRRRSPSVPPADIPLRGPEDALRVVLAVASDPPGPETVVLVLDQAHRGITCLACEGATSAGQVAELGALLVVLSEQEPRVGAVVMATARPGEPVGPSPEDEATYFDLRQSLAEVDVDLLDWFLLADGLAVSVAETVDACWRWTAEPPPA